MARVHECKATAEVSRRLVVRICPVTGGRPTKMTEATFMRLCAANRKTEQATEFGHQYHVSCALCAICKGNQRPKELTIISLDDMAGMVVEKKTNHEVEQMRKQTKCDGCGKSKALSMCSGELLCSSCAALAGAVSNRPELVAKMILQRDRAAEILAGLGVQGAAVEVVESDIMEQLANILGFAPDQEAILADDLLDAVRQLVAASAEPSIKEELVSAQTAIGEICRAVGLDASAEVVEVLTYKQVVLAVAQTAAELEQTRRDLDDRIDDAHILAGDLDHLRANKELLHDAMDRIAEMVDARSFDVHDVVAAVAHTEALIEDMRRSLGIDDQRFDFVQVADELAGSARELQATVTRITGQLSAQADQLAEAEQKLLADEQVFARIREVIGADSSENGDLPTAISALVYAADPLSAQRHSLAERLDARLLHLLLDHPEIGLERIAELREVV